MIISTDSNAGNYGFGGGYQCSICHQWVPNGVTHHCGGSSIPGTTWSFMPDPQHTEVVSLLKQILDLLAPRHFVTLNVAGQVSDFSGEECGPQDAVTPLDIPEQVVALLRVRLGVLREDRGELEQIEKDEARLQQRREWHEMRLVAIQEIEHTLRRAGIDPDAETTDD